MKIAQKFQIKGGIIKEFETNFTKGYDKENYGNRKSKLKESKNSKKPRGSLVPFQYGSVVNNLRLPFVPKCFPALSTCILTQKEIFGQDVKVQLFIVAPKSKVVFEMSVTKRA